MARECEHPDAQWFVALCPSDDHEDVTRALEACPDDPRAMFLLHAVRVTENADRVG
jgi:DNA-directed RNA polymerase specialized sigma24 family protein